MPSDPQDLPERPPMTLRDLIRSNTKVADAVLEQTASINKLVPVLERLRQDVYTLLNNHELDRANYELRLRDFDVHLKLILDNVKDAQQDLREVQRDVTQPRMVLPTQESAVVGSINAFEKLSVTSKVLIAVLVALAAASGWLTHLLK